MYPYIIVWQTAMVCVKVVTGLLRLVVGYKNIQFLLILSWIPLFSHGFYINSTCKQLSSERQTFDYLVTSMADAGKK